MTTCARKKRENILYSVCSIFCEVLAVDLKMTLFSLLFFTYFFFFFNFFSGNAVLKLHTDVFTFFQYCCYVVADVTRDASRRSQQWTSTMARPRAWFSDISLSLLVELAMALSKSLLTVSPCMPRTTNMDNSPYCCATKQYLGHTATL